MKHVISLLKHKIPFFLLLFALFGCCGEMLAWSFGGGYVYFDNSEVKWQDNSIMLIIGKGTANGGSSYASVYEMAPSSNDLWFTALPSGEWGDAEYMAVIGSSTVWIKGNWGKDNLQNANHYAVYTAGLDASAGQGYKLTPSGNSLSLKYLGENYKGVSFTDAEKNACYKIDSENQTITFIFSSSAKRFNTGKRSAVSKVYVYGSVSAWNQTNEAFRLNGYSDDGCYYRTMPLSVCEYVGNSGQPEFLFNVFKYGDENSYTDRAHSSWEGVDSRLLFDNNGVNMIVALPGDDLNEIKSRCDRAKKVDKLSDFDLSQPTEQARIANWRLVPGTKNLYRSYHPYDPSRASYDTEERRLYWVAQLATAAGINCDIALSGDCTGNAGKSYECGGKSYTITIPAYYQDIIAKNRVLYVGTANGHTPSYNIAIFDSGSDRFAQWIQEVVQFILDDAHPAPYQMHCALGSDRTGVFSGTIAALCGASWEQIATDYEATSNLQVNEYRHRNCIRYSLKRLGGVDPMTDATFNAAVRKHFVDGGWLTEAQIEALKAKLNGGGTGNESLIENASLIDGTDKAAKLLNNGMVVIRRGEKAYSVSGKLIVEK